MEVRHAEPEETLSVNERLLTGSQFIHGTQLLSVNKVHHLHLTAQSVLQQREGLSLNFTVTARCCNRELNIIHVVQSGHVLRVSSCGQNETKDQHKHEVREHKEALPVLEVEATRYSIKGPAILVTRNRKERLMCTRAFNRVLFVVQLRGALVLVELSTARL